MVPTMCKSLESLGDCLPTPDISHWLFSHCAAHSISVLVSNPVFVELLEALSDEVHSLAARATRPCLWAIFRKLLHLGYPDLLRVHAIPSSTELPRRPTSPLARMDLCVTRWFIPSAILIVLLMHCPRSVWFHIRLGT